MEINEVTALERQLPEGDIEAVKSQKEIDVAENF